MLNSDGVVRVWLVSSVRSAICHPQCSFVGSSLSVPRRPSRVAGLNRRSEEYSETRRNRELRFLVDFTMFLMFHDLGSITGTGDSESVPFVAALPPPLKFANTQPLNDCITANCMG